VVTGSKVTERDAGHSPISNSEVKNEWSLTSPPPVFLNVMYTNNCTFKFVERENGMTNMMNVKVGNKYPLKGRQDFESKKADTPGDRSKKERCIEGFGENILTRDTVWKTHT